MITTFDLGFPSSAYVGSCAIAAYIHKDKIYVANAGDCNAVLLRRKADGSFESILLSESFSANEPKE